MYDLEYSDCVCMNLDGVIEICAGCMHLKNVGAVHFIYLPYLGLLTNNAQRICPVAGLERMITVSVAKRLTLSRHTGRQTASRYSKNME